MAHSGAEYPQASPDTGLASGVYAPSASPAVKKLHDRSSARCESSKGTNSDHAAKEWHPTTPERLGGPGSTSPRSCYPLGSAGVGYLPLSGLFSFVRRRRQGSGARRQHRLSASRKSVRAHSNASALRSPPLPAGRGLTLISPAWPARSRFVCLDGWFFGLLWLVHMLCRSSRVFSLRVQVPLKRAFAGICQLFEVRPVLGAHNPWQRRIAQPFSQLNPLVQ